MRFQRPTATTALAAAIVSVCYAQQAQIQLSAFPAMSVADGRSTTTITANIRDQRGNPVADGTRVSFESTMGVFRENIVTTANGVARAVLQAGGVPGVAVITVKTVDTPSEPSTMDFEFAGDRSMLSSAMEYIELVSPGHMEFVPEYRIISAAAPGKEVFVRYRDVTIVADDIQINISRYEVRARKARLKVGKLEQEFDELYYKLNEKHGVGITTFKSKLPVPIRMHGFIPEFLSDEPHRYETIGQEVDRWGIVDIKRDEITPALDTTGAAKMRFEDTGASTSSISAKKAIIFPQREIQFHRAEILVTGNRVMQMPLFQLNLMQTTGSSVMNSIVNVNNNQVQINYPYYLSLKPGQTSLFRFRTGQSYGRGISASSGAFLDYELAWNRGDEMDGKFTLSGIGRKDMTVGVQHYMRIDDRTSAFGMLEMPANESLFGSLNLSRMYDGFQLNMSGTLSHHMRGLRYTTQDLSLVAEKDPTKLGDLPVRLYLGVTAQQNSNSLINSTQSAVGLRARLQSQPIRLSNRTTFHGGFSAAHLTGRNVGAGLTLVGEASLSHQLNNSTTFRATYGYLRDGYNDKFLGMHRVGLEARYYTPRINISILANKSLDVNRFSLFGDASFNVYRNWWVSSYYTMDRYLFNDFLDYTFGLGYRVGGREIGLIWSKSTNRIGVQLLGAAF